MNNPFEYLPRKNLSANRGRHPGSNFDHAFEVKMHIEFIQEADFLDEAAAWCCDQFGAACDGRWARTSMAIYVRDPNDAFAFRLRWC